jgi:hypothetical protein
MKGDPVPIQNHISRCCFASKCTEGGQVTGAAFQLRETEEYLSVNWLEYLQRTNRRDEIQEVRRVLNSKLKLTANAKIAVLNVGDILNHVCINSPDNRNLSVLHEPLEDDPVAKDPSHSGIYGFKIDDPLIADLIADMVQETYPARES